MKASNYAPRNNERADSARLPERSPVKNTERRARKPGWGAPKNPTRLPVIEKSTVLTKRARGQQVDGAIGIGRPEMPSEQIARGLARIIRRGVRTAQTREIGGVSLVLSPEIPAGTFALRTVDRITVYRSETGMPFIEVPCEVAGI